MNLRRRIPQTIRDRVGADPPSLRLACWDGDRFDFSVDPAVTIALDTPEVLGRLAACRT